MFTDEFVKEYRDIERRRYKSAGPVFAEKNGRAIAMLKDDWSNYETEMMAWAYHEYYLAETLEYFLPLPGGDLNNEEYYAEAVNAMADYMPANEIDNALEYLSTPFSTVIAMFVDAISFEEIAKAFIDEYRKTNPIMEATPAWIEEKRLSELADQKTLRKEKILKLFGR